MDLQREAQVPRPRGAEVKLSMGSGLGGWTPGPGTLGQRLAGDSDRKMSRAPGSGRGQQGPLLRTTQHGLPRLDHTPPGEWDQGAPLWGQGRCPGEGVS